MGTTTFLNNAAGATTGATVAPASLPADRPVSGPGNPYVMLRRGLHPATRLPLLSGNRAEATCGGCALRFERPTTRGPRDKCAASPFRARGGADVPADFPACQAYTPTAEGSLPVGCPERPGPGAALAPADARSAA